jgi:CBS domain-containing protein
MRFIAKEIMKTPVVSVKPEATLAEVVDLLANHQVSGLPVVNTANEVVGIISEADIVKYSGKTQVFPLVRSSSWLCPYSEITDLAVFRKGIELLANTTVQSIMSKKVVKVNEADSGMEIARAMNKKNINRVPVVNNEGKLVGIITRGDLIKSFAERGID